jgi:hypothetical protein
MSTTIIKYFNSAGANNIFFPNDVGGVKIEGIGGGGAGAYRNSTGNGAGGTGGAYAVLNAFAPVTGTLYAFTVGLGGNTGNNANGVNTVFNTNSLIAKGGVTAGRNNATAQTAPTSSTGDVTHDAGSSAAGQTSKGGGGGSSGGNAANGRTAPSDVGGGNGTDSGNLPAGAGPGGNGAPSGNANGTDGVFPGGGGGGSTRTAGNHNGGNGAVGQLIFTFTTSLPVMTAFGAVEPTNVSSITQSVPIDYPNSMVVCGPSAYDSAVADTQIISMTYNSVNMTQLQKDELRGSPDGSSNYLYALGVASAVTANLVATFTGSCTNPTMHYAVFANAAATADNSTLAPNTAVSTQTGSLTTNADYCIVWSWIGFAANGSGSANGADQFQLGSTETGYAISSVSKTNKHPAGSVTHTYTNGTTDGSQIFMVSIAPYQLPPGKGVQVNQSVNRSNTY